LSVVHPQLSAFHDDFFAPSKSMSASRCSSKIFVLRRTPANPESFLKASQTANWETIKLTLKKSTVLYIYWYENFPVLLGLKFFKLIPKGIFKTFLTIFHLKGQYDPATFKCKKRIFEDSPKWQNAARKSVLHPSGSDLFLLLPAASYIGLRPYLVEKHHIPFSPGIFGFEVKQLQALS